MISRTETIIENTLKQIKRRSLRSEHLKTHFQPQRVSMKSLVVLRPSTSDDQYTPQTTKAKTKELEKAKDKAIFFYS